MDAGPSASSQLNKGDDYASITKVKYWLKLNFFYFTRIRNIVFGNSPTLVLCKQYVFFKNWPWRTLHFLTKTMDFVPSILFQYSVIDNEVYDLLEVNILLKVNMRIEKCEEGTEWTEQGRKHCNCILFLFLYFIFLLIPLYCTCILLFIFSLFTWPGES